MVIFFDLDDTLLDYTGAMRTAAAMFWSDHLRAFKDFSIESFTALWEELATKFGQRLLTGQIAYGDQQRLRMQELFARVGQTITDKQADEFFARFFDYYRQNWRPFKDVRPCLDKLAGVPLGVISNGDSTQQHHKLAAMKIEDRFKTVVISSELGVHKPDPFIFQHACLVAGAPPGECVFIGDQLDGDARAATAAGFHGIWLNRTAQFAPGCDVESIESLKELPPLLGFKEARRWR